MELNSPFILYSDAECSGIVCLAYFSYPLTDDTKRRSRVIFHEIYWNRRWTRFTTSCRYERIEGMWCFGCEEVTSQRREGINNARWWNRIVWLKKLKQSGILLQTVGYSIFKKIRQFLIRVALEHILCKTQINDIILFWGLWIFKFDIGLRLHHMDCGFICIILYFKVATKKYKCSATLEMKLICGHCVDKCSLLWVS